MTFEIHIKKVPEAELSLALNRAIQFAKRYPSRTGITNGVAYAGNKPLCKMHTYRTSAGRIMVVGEDTER